MFMPANPQKRLDPKSGWPVLILRRADQAVVAVLLTAAIVALAGHWVYQYQWRSRLVEIDRVEPNVAAFQIDINQADWPEFCLLPEIGETLAKRIVAHRAENGPFQDIDGLRNIRGIGPKTLERIRPYILPMADVEATAADAPAAISGDS
jgi:competence protein ComEA